MCKNLFKSILHNVGVLAVGCGVALLGVGIDHLCGIPSFDYLLPRTVGWILLASGFFLRIWATFHFYERQMKVIVLSAQKHLITTGPYRFSRNPLYLGGNVFIFLGASLLLGTPSGLAITIIHMPLVDFMIRREERQLEQAFGDEWRHYKKRVRRWL